jgi:hypothetical protein
MKKIIVSLILIFLMVGLSYATIRSKTFEEGTEEYLWNTFNQEEGGICTSIQVSDPSIIKHVTIGSNRYLVITHNIAIYLDDNSNISVKKGRGYQDYHYMRNNLFQIMDALEFRLITINDELFFNQKIKNTWFVKFYHRGKLIGSFKIKCERGDR